MDRPTCGDSFDSEQGMRIHHGHEHGEKLPNRTCKGCGSEFYDPKSRLKYCEDCNPNAGANKRELERGERGSGVSEMRSGV